MAVLNQVTVESSNYSPVIQIVTWIFLAVTVCTILTRLFVRVILAQKLMLDDMLMTVALALMIGQSAVMLSPLGRPLGQSVDRLSIDDIDNAYMALYASQLLMTSSITASKLSILAFLRTLSPVQRHVNLVYACIGLVSCLGLAALVAFGVQCQQPNPWKVVGNQCLNRLAIIVYFDVSSIFTELALISLPTLIIYPLNMSLGARLVVIGFFAMRGLIIVVSCLHISYAYRAFAASDFVLESWPYLVTGQILQSVTLVVTCVPYLKTFFQALESGYFRTDDHRRQGRDGSYTPHPKSRDIARMYYVNISGSRAGGVPLNEIHTHVTAG